MAFGYEDFEPLIGAIEALWVVFFTVFDVLLLRFLELVVDYMLGNIIDNVIFMTFFFIILSTALILTFKFMS